MEKTIEQEVKGFFKIQQNNFCFECGGLSNQWTSVNNGIFLCLACSGIHKGLSSRVSIVKSLTLDTWIPVDLELMKNGGNDRLKVFFEEYSIPLDGPVDAKYKTKAAYYYREKLRAIAEGLPLPEAPTLEEGSQLMENRPIQAPAVIGSSSETPSGESNLAKSKTFKMTMPKVVMPNKEEMAQGFKTFGESMAVGAKNMATGAKTMANKFNEKMKESNFKEDVQVFGNKFAVGAKDAAGKGAAAARKGYIGAVGFFKNLTNKKKTPVNDENKDYTNLDRDFQEDYQQYGYSSSFNEEHQPSISL